MAAFVIGNLQVRPGVAGCPLGEAEAGHEEAASPLTWPRRSTAWAVRHLGLRRSWWLGSGVRDCLWGIQAHAPRPAAFCVRAHWVGEAWCGRSVGLQGTRRIVLPACRLRASSSSTAVFPRPGWLHGDRWLARFRAGPRPYPHWVEWPAPTVGAQSFWVSCDLSLLALSMIRFTAPIWCVHSVVRARIVSSWCARQGW